MKIRAVIDVASQKRLRGALQCAARTFMKKAETLAEIKRAEAEIRDMKSAADQEKERVLRDARREVLDLQESLRQEAEGAAAAIVRAADEQTAKERESVLAAGRKDAEARKSAGLANVDRAVELVVRRFQGALDA